MEKIVVQKNPLFSSAMQIPLQVLLTGLSTVALLGLIFFWWGGAKIEAYPEVLQLLNDEISARL